MVLFFSLLDTRYDILDTDLKFAKEYHYSYNYKKFKQAGSDNN